ncbi:MAG: hypothetical protein Q7U60_02350 [Candidatus Methanoperedens sp.]|nr:hypothetical protein [Candidatus Methanoperedens sp.]
MDMVMKNPSANDAVMNVDLKVKVPTGFIIVSVGDGFGQPYGDKVDGTFKVPPGTQKTTHIVIKADKSIERKSYYLSVDGLFYPSDSKDKYEDIYIISPITIKESASNKPSVNLHGEKTDVALGEDIILKLSAVNLITSPVMTVQVILIPPSGMSVTSAEFVESGAGQYTTTYELNPGKGRDIEVRIKANQIGEFNVKGRIIYYYGNDKSTAENRTLTLPIIVKSDKESKGSIPAPKSPGFAGVLVVISIFIISRTLFKI